MRPRLLDLFCGAGGAAVGYHRAGFDVVGVDLAPQPRYPFEFHQADALAFPLAGFDVVHASPPCQAYSPGRHMWKGRLPDDRHRQARDLLPAMRERLRDWGGVYVLENVPGAPLESPVVVCGRALGLGVKRHRLFESNALLLVPPCPRGHPGHWVSVFGGSALDRTPPGGGAQRADGTWPVMQRRKHVPHREAAAAMGIDWMSRRELAQAIPPAYTLLVGAQLHAAVRAAA